MGLEELRAVGLVLFYFALAIVGLPGLFYVVMRKLIEHENRQVTGASYVISLDPMDLDLRRN